jgi:hypothetical protein
MKYYHTSSIVLDNNLSSAVVLFILFYFFLVGVGTAIAFLLAGVHAVTFLIGLCIATGIIFFGIPIRTVLFLVGVRVNFDWSLCYYLFSVSLKLVYPLFLLNHVYPWCIH